MNRRKFTLLMELLLITGAAYCQYFDSYEKEKLLLPAIDTTVTKELVSFLATDTGKLPEHSIRIIEKDKQTFIVARILKNTPSANYYMSSARKDSIKTVEFTKPITDNFKLKMMAAFQKAIDLHSKIHVPLVVEDASGSVKVRIYDGVHYNFTVKYSNNFWSMCEILPDLEQNDFIRSVAQANQRIVNDLNNGTFNEADYEIYK